jgi:hypothetical protein
VRNTRLALSLLPVAALALAACSEPKVAASPPPPTSTSTITPSPTTTVATSAASTTTATKATTPACQPQNLKAEPGSGGVNGGVFAVTTAVKNTGPSPCVLQGYPQVAITGLPPATGDWPHKQLTITKDGPSYPVTLTPGDGAVVTLKFTTCQNPTHGPVLLLGVPDTAVTMTLEGGGDFVECGDTARVTAFEAHLP